MSESVVFFVLLLCRVLFSDSSEFFLVGIELWLRTLLFRFVVVGKFVLSDFLCCWISDLFRLLQTHHSFHQFVFAVFVGTVHLSCFSPITMST